MSNEKFLKITYHGGSVKGSKLNAYLKMPSPTYAVLMREISICLFEQRQQPKTDVRAYWIDEDGDEIEIVNQCDYEIFMSKRSERRHLQVAPIGNSEKSATSSSTDTDPSVFVIHERVECDNCGNAPIVGFRYKCIQCPNFDLCEVCEGQHKHSEHMMVRMPNENCPSVVEAWISGRANRRHHKRNGPPGVCPFVANTAAPSGEAANKSADGKDHHHHSRHGRKHEKHRRQMQNGIFAHLYNMMHDLAEGGPAVDSEVKAANTAVHEAAHNAATKAASASAAAAAASAAAATAASHVLFGMPTAAPTAPNETTTQDKGAVPKTPPTTPSNNGTTEEPEFKKSKEANNNESVNASNESEPTTPVLPFVNPNFIKILNNFSEMFGKMLDPMDGSSDDNITSSCPFAPAGFPQQRKSSTSSNTSSNASTTNTTIGKQTEKPQEDKTMEVNSTSATSPDAITVSTTILKQMETTQEDKPIEENARSAGTLESATETTTVTETVVENVSSTNSKKSTPEPERSQSEENDWQLIDKQTTSNESLVSISASISSDSIDGAAALPSTSRSVDITSVTTIPAASAASTQTQATQINYDQLSKDLRAHILQEQAMTQTPTVPVPEVAEDSQRAVPVYHSDQRINDAVLAMMAMGFSNEGAWLTQLLESVNGSIPQALDLMSAAQRST